MKLSSRCRARYWGRFRGPEGRRLSFRRTFNYLAIRSFPTRRSSDLGPLGDRPRGIEAADREVRVRQYGVHRSEEHTSELQSRVDLVCRLPLEKKKKPSRCRARHWGGFLGSEGRRFIFTRMIHYLASR